MTARGTRSQNGWTVISQSYTREWTIAGRTFPVRRGCAGFVLMHWAWYFTHNVEEILPGVDDWGWSLRRISGSEEWSNHASGTAIDLNADKHPQGIHNTFDAKLTERIRVRLADRYQNVIRWGGDYAGTVDEMHFEIVGNFKQTKALADVLHDTSIGKELRKIRS